MEGGISVMHTAFSNALYYPTIDIGNTDWLKTAVLFWDAIYTIVPESNRQPYKQNDTQYLADKGILCPLTVNSNHESVVAIEEDILQMMYSPEFLQAICNPHGTRSRIFGGKMSYRLRENLEHFFHDFIYAEKMSWRIREHIRDITRHLDDDEIYYLDEEFTYLYMVALANQLCKDTKRLGMVTDDVPCFNIGNTVRLGNQTSLFPENFRNRRPREHQLEQGLLLDFIINGLSIAPDNTLEDIVKFRESSLKNGELGRFRTQLSKLTQSFDGDKSVDFLRQEISDLYNNEFIPAFEDFKAALKGAKIKWFTETFLKVSVLSASATGIPMALLGLPIPQALFAGAGASVIASAVSYNVDREKQLRENPYAYLLSIKREFG
jgi:hypothetical protein